VRTKTRSARLLGLGAAVVEEVNFGDEREVVVAARRAGISWIASGSAGAVARASISVRGGGAGGRWKRSITADTQPSATSRPSPG
jgi:hypothetical protein